MTGRAWIGLGGNIGDVRATMAAALDALASRHPLRIAAVSRLYATPAWGLAEQPGFLNAVAEVVTGLAPLALLEACLDVERGLKRERLLRWGPRTIDLDILAMEGVDMETDRLTIPHRHLAQRAFALAPLADMAPDLLVGGVAVARLLAAVDAQSVRPVAQPEEWWSPRPPPKP